MDEVTTSPAAALKEATIMTNFRWPKSVRSRLSRIVKERRSGVKDKKEKRKITMTSVAADLIREHPVNWKA